MPAKSGILGVRAKRSPRATMRKIAPGEGYNVPAIDDPTILCEIADALDIGYGHGPD
jgi:hypothetical protein